MNVNLVVVEGRPLGAVIPLKAHRFVIGRDQGCQLRPRGEEVADRHCAILQDGPMVSVRDLGGTGGTLVNNRCLRGGDEVRVRDGDRLQVGHLIFSIQIDGDRLDGPGGGMQDWLAGPAPPPRRSGASSIVSAASIGVEPSAMATPAGVPAATFAFSVFEESRRVACLGLSPGQVAEDSAVRALRASLFAFPNMPRQRRILLDLSAIDDLPSPAVAMLLTLARLCESKGGELRLCSPPEPVRQKLDALRFETVLAYYPDQSEALADPWD